MVGAGAGAGAVLIRLGGLGVEGARTLFAVDAGAAGGVRGGSDFTWGDEGTLEWSEWPEGGA